MNRTSIGNRIREVMRDALNSADSMNEVRLMIKLGGEGGIEKYSREHKEISLVDQVD